MILGKSDIVFSVIKQRNPTFQLKNNRLKILNAGRFLDLEFNNETIYNFDGSSFAFWSDILRIKNIFNANCGFHEISYKDQIKLL